MSAMRRAIVALVWLPEEDAGSSAEAQVGLPHVLQAGEAAAAAGDAATVFTARADAAASAATGMGAGGAAAFAAAATRAGGTAAFAGSAAAALVGRAAAAAATAAPAPALAAPAPAALMGGTAAACAGHVVAMPWPAAAAASFAGRGGALPSLASDGGLRVIPDEDRVAEHEAMEFHLGGRHWLDLVPTNRTSTDLVSNQPSSDDGSACGPSSNG